ncbi:6725_t:CDS:1, partial [Ambispora leptoticha]
LCTASLGLNTREPVTGSKYKTDYSTYTRFPPPDLEILSLKEAVREITHYYGFHYFVQILITLMHQLRTLQQLRILYQLRVLHQLLQKLWF